MKKIILLICVLSLMGCTAVSDRGIKDAYKACESHGGITMIRPLILFGGDSCVARCKDGFQFDIHQNYKD